MTPVEYLSLPYKRYLVYDSEIEVYTAGVEEFPGCIAEGETVEEALERLEQNALAWVEVELEEGRSIPQPLMFEEPSSSVRLSLRLPPALHRSAVDWARQNSTSLNQTVVTAVSYFLGAERAVASFVAGAHQWQPSLLTNRPGATTQFPVGAGRGFAYYLHVINSADNATQTIHLQGLFRESAITEEGSWWAQQSASTLETGEPC